MRVIGPPWFHGLARHPITIAPATHVDLPFAFEQAVLQDPPAEHGTSRWLRPLPPGRYRVRATYEKRDAQVPVGQPTWHPRLIQVQPLVRLRPVPGLWLGRMQGSAAIEIVAPRVDDVDALRARVEAREARNAALQGQLDRIREILRGG